MALVRDRVCRGCSKLVSCMPRICVSDHANMCHGCIYCNTWQCMHRRQQYASCLPQTWSWVSCTQNMALPAYGGAGTVDMQCCVFFGISGKVSTVSFVCWPYRSRFFGEVYRCSTMERTAPLYSFFCSFLVSVLVWFAFDWSFL